MTPLQTESLKTAQHLANELRLTVARLLTLPVPMADDSAIAMRGAEMACDALMRINQARLRKQLLDETSAETMARLAESREQYSAENK